MAIADTSGQDVALAPKSHARRWIVSAVLAIAFIAVAWAFAPQVLRWSSAQASVPRDRLRVATVRYDDLVRDVSVQGRVVAAVSPTLFASAAGTITLLVESGVQVDAGQALAIVESPELQNQLQQEQANLERQRVEVERQRITTRQLQLASQKNVDLAEVDLIAADREKRRAEIAFETQAIAEIDLEKAEDDLSAAELAHRHALLDIELDRERLSFEIRTLELQLEGQDLLVQDLQRQVDELTIGSPVTGIVGNLQVDQKAAVTQNQPIMAVVDLTAFEVEADVPESYADDLGLGMAAEVYVGAVPYDATVVAVSPEIIDNQVTTRLRFPADPPPGLRQNQRLTTRILIERKPNVLTVDRGQFLDAGAGRIAYVIDDGVARRRSIEIGARSLVAVEVVDGLSDGDVIIISSIEAFAGVDTVLITN